MPVLRLCISSILAFALIMLIMACPHLYAETTTQPDPLAWYEDWKRIVKLPKIHSDLITARIALNSKTSTIDLIDNRGIAIGELSISLNRNTIGQFHMYKTSIGSKDIGLQNARKNADAFIHALAGPLKGIEKVTEPAEIDDAGKYIFNYFYYFQNIDYYSIDVDIDHAGYVVSCYIHPSLQELYNIRLEDLKPSPDEATVLARLRKALAVKGYEKVNVKLGTRAYLNGKYTWSAVVDMPPQADGSIKCYLFTYIEDTETCMLTATFIKSSANMPERKRPAYPQDTDPVWMPDGSTVCWTTGCLWDQCPPWIPNHPYSLAIHDGKNGEVAAYRPLPDTSTTLPVYHNASPSPDGRYLACTIDDEILAVVDRQTNQLTSARKLQGKTLYLTARVGRASWSPDSRSLLLTVNGRVCRWTATGVTSIFANPPELLPIPGLCRAVEYLPGAVDTLIALYQEPNADEEQWHIARLKLVAGKLLAIDLLVPAEVTSPLHDA